MSAGTLAPYTFPQAFDDDGDPLDGGLLYTYAAGTSTPATTYTDADLTVPNTNPIVLTAGGRYKIYIDALSYKFVLQNADGVVIDTTDPVGSVGLTQSGVYDVFSFFGDPTSPVTAATYPTGTTFDKCHAGTALYTVDRSTLAPGTYKLSGMLLSTGGVTLTVALVNLSDGNPDTAMVTLTSSSTTGESVMSTAITFAAGGAAKTYGIKAEVVSGSGFAWALQIVKTS